MANIENFILEILLQEQELGNAPESIHDLFSDLFDENENLADAFISVGNDGLNTTIVFEPSFELDRDQLLRIFNNPDFEEVNTDTDSIEFVFSIS